MKPITSILLALALICYVFLPFYEISFQGGLTGFSYTAGTITQRFTLGNTVFALLPFITCFAAIGFNTLKNRWWGIVVTLLIVVGLWFLDRTGNYHDIALRHAPDITPSEDVGEGFAIIALGIGYKASLVLLVSALCSAILSMLPFKFNERIERAVDERIDHSLEDMRALGRSVSEWNESHLRHPRKAPATPAETAPPAEPADKTAVATPTPPPLPEDPEDPSRFMPKQ